MKIIFCCIAAFLWANIAQCAESNSIIGQWLAENTDKNGVGTSLTFYGDKQFVRQKDAFSEFDYRIDGDQITTTLRSTDGVEGNTKTHRFKLENSSLTIGVGENSKKRIELTRAQNLFTGNHPIVGVWRFKHHTGGMGVMVFHDTNKGQLNVFMTQAVGTYDVNGQQLVMHPNKQSDVQLTWAVDGDALVLESKNGIEKFIRAGQSRNYGKAELLGNQWRNMSSACDSTLIKMVRTHFRDLDNAIVQHSACRTTPDDNNLMLAAVAPQLKDKNQLFDSEHPLLVNLVLFDEENSRVMASTSYTFRFTKQTKIENISWDTSHYFLSRTPPNRAFALRLYTNDSLQSEQEERKDTLTLFEVKNEKLHPVLENMTVSTWLQPKSEKAISILQGTVEMLPTQTKEYTDIELWQTKTDDSPTQISLYHYNGDKYELHSQRSSSKQAAIAGRQFSVFQTEWKNQAQRLGVTASNDATQCQLDWSSIPSSHNEKEQKLKHFVFAINVVDLANHHDQLSICRPLAREVLQRSDEYKDQEFYGYAIHKANIVLGRAALADGDIDTAKKHLLASTDHNGSASLNSFGPNMKLAKELLERGVKDTVLQYFEYCRRFWVGEPERCNKKPSNEQDNCKYLAQRHTQTLQEWIDAVNANKSPEFRANLFY